MAWRKVHFGDEVWEWRAGKNVSHYVIVRSPSKIATRISSSKLGIKAIVHFNCDGDLEDIYPVTPGLVRAYIKSHREILMVKSEKKGG
jgi:hypothetical protein